MRIDGLSNIPASIRTNVADLLGRLDTGDVIKAKVLEITSSEVLLRLFDGTVLKAATAEGMEAKVGQNLSLAVISKAEGTLVLETVKDFSQLNNITPDILENMLEALQIKPDAKNMELAAEFMKAGITASAAQLDKAAGLMESFKGLNAEKAVFIALKGLKTDQIKIELLTKLLDGELKLGEQLKELQTALNNISKKIGKSTTNDALARTIFETVETALTFKASTASNTNTQVSQQSTGLNSNTAKTQTSTISNKAVSSLSSTDAAGAGTTAHAVAAKSTSAGQQGSMGTSAVTVGQQGSMGTSAMAAGQQGAAGTSETASGPENSNSSTSAALTSSASDVSTLNAALNASEASRPGNSSGVIENAEQTVYIKDTQVDKGTGNAFIMQYDAISKAGDESASQSIHLTSASQDDNINPSGKAYLNPSDPFAKMRDAIKELFVNIHSDKLASELDINKLHKDLHNKLEILNTDAVQASDLKGMAGGENLSATTALLDDSVKLINQLNSNSMLYYQLPVNLSGYQTTAELYVMKRRQNQKRVDPHNTVMFVSLDTNNLGRVETLLDVKGNNVSINLRTEMKQINDFVKENIKYLYSGLADCGYKLVDIRYALIDSATSPVKQEQLLSKMMDANHSKVDMRI